MKRLICFLIVLMIVPFGANAGTVRFDNYTNILGSALTGTDELQVWNNGNIRNITVDNLWSYYTGKNTYQPLDSDLTYLAGVTLSNDIKTFLNAASAALAATALGLGTGDNPSFNSVHASGGNLAAANKQVVKAWQTSLPYVTQETAAVHGGKIYICTSSHTAGASTEPGVGADWATVWAEVQGAGDGSLTDLDDLPGDTVDDNLIDVGLIADLGPMIHGKTGKATPVDADIIPLSDSAASWALKALTWANLKATLKSYMDTLYIIASSVDNVTWGTSSGGSQTWTWDTGSGTDPSLTIADDSFTVNKKIIAPGLETNAADGTHHMNVDNTASYSGTTQGDIYTIAGVPYVYRTAARQIWDAASVPYPAQGTSATPTAGRITKWDASGRVLVDGPEIGTASGTVAAGDHTHSGYLATGGDLDSLETGITGLVKGGGNGSGYGAATAGTDYEVPDTQTSTHSSPSTTNPLSPTWTSNMHTVWYGATGTINLPAASGYAARSIMIYNTGAFTITIDPNASEVIVRDGTAQTGGVSMTLSSGAGNYVALLCDGVRWVTFGYKGTLAAGS